MSVGALAQPQPVEAFRHEALLYAGETDFLACAIPFIRDAVRAEEPVLVVVSAARIGRLRAGLGDDANAVYFGDMDEVGANPARIIPRWREFVSEHAGSRRLRGIGEPIWRGRSPAELVECQRHESLLNVAFDGVPAWWLLCPYDIETLDPTVVDEAYRSHPFVMQGSTHRESATYRGVDMAAAPFDATLPEPPGKPSEFAFGFGAATLRALRAFVSGHAARSGLGPARTADLLLAVQEVATNSLRHGGGQGGLRIWQDADALVCEIHDQGHIDQPLVGREHPPVDQDGGRGMWLINQLCDLVQLRSFPTGTIVRLHMWHG